jgi:hypothetical protein
VGISGERDAVMRWYLDTWRTSAWRHVLATVLLAAGFVVWEWTLAVARDEVRGGGPWTAILAGRAAGVAVAALLIAAGLAVEVRLRATEAGGSASRELAGAALAFLAVFLFRAGRVVGERSGRGGAMLLAAACVAFGSAALAWPRRGPIAWAWAVAWLAVGGWLAWTAP